MTRIIGIDPGKSGACVVLEDGKPTGAILTADRFLLNVAKGKRRKMQYVPNEMARWLLEASAFGGPVAVVIERQQPYPQQGGVSNYSTGYGYGLWRGIIASLGLECTEVHPKTWQKKVLAGQPGDGKQRAVLFISSRLPDLDLTPGLKRKPHDGLADAGCLCLYGLAQ